MVSQKRLRCRDCWLCAHEIDNLPHAEGVKAIDEPDVPHALRLSAQLLFGLTKIHNQQVLCFSPSSSSREVLAS